MERGKNDITQKGKQAGTKPTRRYLTRNTATKRVDQEGILAAAISMMELSQNPENLEVHAVLLHQILENVESKLRDFVEEKIIRGQVQPLVNQHLLWYPWCPRYVAP